jgi:hypothetical protein
MDNDLLCPPIILIPITRPHRIIVLIWPVNCTYNISSNVTISEYAFNSVFPLVPVLICQVISVSDLVNIRILLRPNQFHSSIRKFTFVPRVSLAILSYPRLPWGMPGHPSKLSTLGALKAKCPYFPAFRVVNFKPKCFKALQEWYYLYSSYASYDASD